MGALRRLGQILDEAGLEATEHAKLLENGFGFCAFCGFHLFFLSVGPFLVFFCSFSSFDILQGWIRNN